VFDGNALITEYLGDESSYGVICGGGSFVGELKVKVVDALAGMAVLTAKSCCTASN
jgi:hypothetical protein